uniref:Uncharacterized protein n=1 Tax=Magnetospirillum gryphiswaldense TaxID=55518 RepID=A4U0D4_9PROT|nr:hypothetical protein MGR_0377 [Magnetospirillum gryphiswaldense MSR-1]
MLERQVGLILVLVALLIRLLRGFLGSRFQFLLREEKSLCKDGQHLSQLVVRNPRNFPRINYPKPTRLLGCGSAKIQYLESGIFQIRVLEQHVIHDRYKQPQMAIRQGVATPEAEPWKV